MARDYTEAEPDFFPDSAQASSTLLVCSFEQQIPDPMTEAHPPYLELCHWARIRSSRKAAVAREIT
jgi:hypothetical protein